jgi:predicted acyltransferase
VEQGKKRLVSVDLLRGLAVWGMLFNGNRYKSDYWWKGFSHGSWFETTFVDLVYPIFLIVIGIGLSFNFSEESPKKAYLAKVLKRVLRLVLLGMFLKALPYFEKLAPTGTLQCIGYALAIAAGIICYRKKYALVIALSLSLVAHLLTILAVSSADRWQKGRTFFEQVDLALIGHTGGVEGVITTLLAAGFILYGFSAKNFLIDSTLRYKTILGSLLFAVGILLHILPQNSFLSVPMIPRLFSLSFTLFCLGAALFGYVLFEIGLKLPIKSLLLLIFLPFGANSILAYAGVIAFRKILFETCLIHCSVDNPRFNDWLITTLSRQIGMNNAVHLYTSFILLLAWLGCIYLNRKKIFIRI